MPSDIEKNIAAVRTSTIVAIKEALAQPAQEPFTYYNPARDAIRPFKSDGDIALYTTPPAAQPAQKPVALMQGTDIDDLVAEFESTPEGADAMKQGRKWLEVGQPAQPAPVQEPEARPVGEENMKFHRVIIDNLRRWYVANIPPATPTQNTKNHGDI